MQVHFAFWVAASCLSKTTSRPAVMRGPSRCNIVCCPLVNAHWNFIGRGSTIATGWMFALKDTVAMMYRSPMSMKGSGLKTRTTAIRTSCWSRRRWLAGRRRRAERKEVATAVKEKWGERTGRPRKNIAISSGEESPDLGAIPFHELLVTRTQKVMKAWRQIRHQEMINLKINLMRQLSINLDHPSSKPGEMLLGGAYRVVVVVFLTPNLMCSHRMQWCQQSVQNQVNSYKSKLVI